MTSANPPAPKARPPRRDIRAIVAAQPELVAIVVYAIVAMGATVVAFLSVSTIWANYDDEGTLLVTLKAFAQGDTLYRDVYSAYGPFYYELFGGLFALSGQEVTTNASRSIVIVLWVATSLLFGLATQRLTDRLSLGVVGMIAAFATLGVLAHEPMHPQGLCVFLLGSFTLLAVVGPTRRAAWAGGGAGALLAALLLTKVNLGVFALAALALAAVFTAPSLGWRWLRWPVIVGVLALPVVVVARDLGTDWVRDFVLLETLAMAAIVIAAWPPASPSGRDDDELGQWLLGALLGFGLGFVAILATIVLNGSSPADIYDSVIVEAMRVRDVVFSPFSFPPAAVDWAVAAVIGAALVTRLRSGGDGAPSIWPGLLRLAAGLAIWFSVAGITPLAINPSAGNPNSLPLVLAWIAVIAPGGASEQPYKRFLRVLLPALAVAETLQVYPVAGSQVRIAALTFVPVGAICVADGLSSLRAWARARGAFALERFGIVSAVVSVGLASMFALDAIVRPAATKAVIYRDQVTLPIAGADMLRLPAADVEAYTTLVELLRRHRCTAFIGYPSVNSLHLWSALDAPRPTAPGAWPELLDAERQQRVVDELRAARRPCAIRNDGLAGLWLGGDPPPDRPLVNYVLNEFEPVAEVGDFQFMLPRDRSQDQ